MGMGHRSARWFPFGPLRSPARRGGPSLFAYRVVQDLFNSLGPQEKAWLENAVPLVVRPQGHILYDPASPQEGLFLIKKGRVSLFYLSPEGKRLDFCHLGPGDLFGEMPLLGQRMGSAHAEAATQVVLCLLDRPTLETFFVHRPRVALALLQRIGKCSTEARALLEDLAFKGVEARLASLLLRLGRGGPSVLEGITHERLAEQVGASRETVTRALKRLEGRGLVKVARKRITITDEEGLRRVALQQAPSLEGP